MSDSTVELKAILKDEISPALKGIQAQVDTLGKTGKNAGESLSQGMDHAASSTGKATSEVGGMSSGLANLAGGFYMARQAAGVLASGVMAIVDAAKQYDSVRARLTATEGSPLVAADDLKRLQELAKLPGLGFGEASNAMAALRSLHVSAKDTFALIEGIAKGNASMGGGAEAFGRVMYQIQQSIGKSKVSMEDLRPVMEAIPNIGSMIAEKFGSIDSDAINKKLASMGQTSKDFWMDIAEMASKLPPAGDTIANNIDNIGDAWTRFKASLANNDVIKSATGVLANFIDAVARRNEKADEDNRLRAQARSNLGKNGFLSQLMYGDTGGDEAIEKEVARIRAQEEARTYAIKAVNAQKDADAIKEQERRRKQAQADEDEEKRKKKAHTAAIAEAKRVQAEILRIQEGADSEFSRSTGVSYGAYSTAHPGGVDREDESPSLTKGMQKARADEAKKKEELRKKIKEIDERIVTQEERTATARMRLAEKVAAAQEKSAEEQIKAQRDIAQAGERTFATLATVAENSSGKQAAAYKTLFAVSKGFAIADASIQIADALAKSANEPFPLNVAAMATTAALTAGIVADIQAVTMRARGGPMYGGIVGERGPERITPIVPSVITPAHKTVNQYGGNSITIIVKGGVDNRTLRNIREAVTDRRQSSR